MARDLQWPTVSGNRERALNRFLEVTSFGINYHSSHAHYIVNAMYADSAVGSPSHRDGR